MHRIINKNIMWEEAIKNTISIEYQSILGRRWFKTCKNCNVKVESTPTREMWYVGNLPQRITICNNCNKSFIEDLYY